MVHKLPFGFTFQGGGMGMEGLLFFGLAYTHATWESGADERIRVCVGGKPPAVHSCSIPRVISRCTPLAVRANPGPTKSRPIIIKPVSGQLRKNKKGPRPWACKDTTANGNAEYLQNRASICSRRAFRGLPPVLCWPETVLGWEMGGRSGAPF